MGKKAKKRESGKRQAPVSQTPKSLPAAPLEIIRVRGLLAVERPAEEIHTIVLHLNPDLEALFMAWVILAVASIREFFRIRKSGVRFKLIGSGVLRRPDWEKEMLPDGRPIPAAVLTDLNTSALEALGYKFVDCGGGGAELDQHGLEANRFRNVTASLSRLKEIPELAPLFEPGGRCESITPLAEVVIKNDLTGLSVARDFSMELSVTPNTARTARNMIAGWNVLVDQGVLKFHHMVGLAFVTFHAAEAVVVEDMARRYETGQRLRRATGEDPFAADAASGTKEYDARRANVFHYLRLRHGLREWYQSQILDPSLGSDPFVSAPSKAMGSTESASEEQKVRVWNRWAQLAFQACQDDWEQAVKDTRRNLKFRSFQGILWHRTDDPDHPPANGGRAVVGEVRVAWGASNARRFGQYVRSKECRVKTTTAGLPAFADDGDPLYPDIVIQFGMDKEGKFNGRFMASSRLSRNEPVIRLDGPAMLIRMAEFLKRKATDTVTPEFLAWLASPGNVTVAGEEGEVSLPYFTEFRTLVGTRFFSNPFLEPSELSCDEVVYLVCLGLGLGMPLSELVGRAEEIETVVQAGDEPFVSPLLYSGKCIARLWRQMEKLLPAAEEVPRLLGVKNVPCLLEANPA